MTTHRIPCILALTFALGAAAPVTHAGQLPPPKPRDKHSDECRAEAYKKQCTEWAQWVSKACRVLPLGNFSDDVLAMFPDTLRNFDAKIAEFKAFHAEWAGCGGDCADTRGWEDCESAPKKMRSDPVFDKLVKALERKRNIAREKIEIVARKASDSYMRELAELSRMFHSYEDFPLRAIPADILSVAAEIDAALTKAEADMEKQLAAVDCGPHEYKNKAVAATITKIVTADQKKAAAESTTGFVEELKKLTLASAPKLSHNALERRSYEDMMVYLCVTQQRPNQKLDCRRLEIRFQREKPAGGKWSEWKGVGVGSADLMSCKNLGL